MIFIVVANPDRYIVNRGSGCCKLEQNNYESGQLLQIGAQQHLLGEYGLLKKQKL